MRVTQNMLYGNFVSNMNNATYKLMQLNMQASSQKKVNRPSDDPIGTARILGYRDSISSLNQYQDNVDTAKGWLGLADETLMQVNNVLIRAKELAEQGATGTLSEEQREILSYEAWQLYDQMMTLSNTKYEGKAIFAGHKVDGSAFEPAMGVSSNKDLNDGDVVSVTGKTGGTVLVQFLDDGAVGTDDLDYRYSTDGGKTWTQTTLAAGDDELDLDGVVVQLASGYSVEANDGDDTNDTSGTWLWVRPTAKYLGDDQDVNTVSLYAQDIQGDVQAIGSFAKDVTVRIDAVDGSDVTYSYSLDGGYTWNTGNSTVMDGDEARFLVPGGRVEVDVAGGELSAGDQLLVRPHRAAINIEISPGESIQVNHVGKDVFGGIYSGPGDKGVEGPGNVFETLGELIGYLETNNQAGIQQSLEDIDECLKHINSQLASVGARENRLFISESVLSGLVINERERKSKIEDIDVPELMTKLANQQIVYEAVLRSSSTIMRMSLVNHI
ncbi:flagellar hook-associated protein FlgL [Desulfonatronovibrio hydrogenovorans]|uniref:flagellar hook-associated protein FlgL n=1 Tax=Desulfonatronovibrio hydrogenovorans TaxID=53245 RepID=UPI0004920F8E|nr:flagellar hook-associated protein FlgL [Desulfonatronovibrio hydrogenovorans]